jgi:hypothetical protein
MLLRANDAAGRRRSDSQELEVVPEQVSRREARGFGPVVECFQADPSKTAWMPLVLFVRFETFQRVVT